MADSPASPDTDRPRPTRGSAAGMPRWVMVFLIIFIALVVLFVILHLTGNGFGQGMHMSALKQGISQA
jgi:hypothetical protein